MPFAVIMSVSHLRMGASCLEDQPCVQRVGAFSPTPRSLGEGLEAEFGDRWPVI